MVCKHIVKFVLVALNFVILLFGAATGVIGGLLRWGNEAILNKLYEWIKNICSQAGLLCDPGNSIDHDLNMISIVNTIGIVLFAIGLVIFAIGAAGFFGTIFTVKLLLKIYTGVLGIISALIIALSIFFLTAESLMASIVNPLLSNLVRSTFVDAWQLRKELSFSAYIINAAMVELKCCGFESPQDYSNSKNWNRTYAPTFLETFEDRVWHTEDYLRKDKEMSIKIGEFAGAEAQVPTTCCKLLNYQFLSDIFNLTLLDKNCPIKPRRNNSYIETQCFGAFRSWIMSDFTLALVIVGSIWLVITAIVALTSWYLNMKPSEVKPENQ